ncbi:MAG TPA: peptidoglycan DD-metalloendopeptidase family protein [Kofleriaceae bacterium]|nr:peptidoglycan DD-metalloendopeptidase family protein [Kofleriaceae bacterium]
MWRTSALALVLVVAPALVGEEPRAQSRAGAPEPADVHLLPRDALARQVADELAAIDRTLSQVGAKLGEADATRARRLAAAIRLLRAPLGGSAGDPGAGMAAARRRAAARLLLERDLTERGLLADEAAQLRRAADQRRADAARIPELELPAELGRPASGKVVRRYGAIAHERSKATLSRRGIDLDVEPQAVAVAAADGVVRYAGPIRGLDAGVIVDHGGFLTVVAKLGALAVPVGAPVRRGDRLGRAARERVYLEVRIKLGPGGIPIDPEPLLAKRPS